MVLAEPCLSGVVGRRVVNRCHFEPAVVDCLRLEDALLTVESREALVEFHIVAVWVSAELAHGLVGQLLQTVRKWQTVLCLDSHTTVLHLVLLALSCRLFARRILLCVV